MTRKVVKLTREETVEVVRTKILRNLIHRLATAIITRFTLKATLSDNSLKSAVSNLSIANSCYRVSSPWVSTTYLSV